jgi:hypothetical protein
MLACVVTVFHKILRYATILMDYHQHYLFDTRISYDCPLNPKKFLNCRKSYPRLFLFQTNIVSFHDVRACNQVVGWCTDCSEDIKDHIGKYDNPDDYDLLPADADQLRIFLLGSAFHPILTALDADPERVAAREKKEEDVLEFQSSRRRTGLRELDRWLGDLKEFDEDDYSSTPNAKIPMQYGDWLELDHILDDVEEGAEGIDKAGQRLLTNAVQHLMTYVHNMHYKLDYLLGNSKNTQHSAGPAAAEEELRARHPFLNQCDDHVFKLPPLQAPDAVQDLRGKHFPSCICIFS